MPVSRETVANSLPTKTALVPSMMNLNTVALPKIGLKRSVRIRICVCGDAKAVAEPRNQRKMEKEPNQTKRVQTESITPSLDPQCTYTKKWLPVALIA